VGVGGAAVIMSFAVGGATLVGVTNRQPRADRLKTNAMNRIAFRSGRVGVRDGWLDLGNADIRLTLLAEAGDLRVQFGVGI